MPKKIWFYSILSGVLLSLPGYPVFSGIILFFAFIPLLYVQDFLYQRKLYFSLRSAFLHFMLTFFVWQLLSFWWVSNVTIAGALFLIIFNSLFYSGIFLVVHWVYRVMGVSMGRIAFVVIWLAAEYISLHVDFALPWLLLGNGLANTHRLVQWYEYSGVLGGSLWILVVNLLLFDVISLFRGRLIRMLVIKIMLLLLVFLIPVALSEMLYQKAVPCEAKYKVAIIQPNIDPYTEKFSGLTQEDQLGIILHLAHSVSKDSIDFYIAPETAIDNQLWEDVLHNNIASFTIDEFVHSHPRAAFVIGAITYKSFLKGEKPSLTARYDQQDKIYYDMFNTALYFDTTQNIQLYHKSKLVLGVEKAPLLGLFKFLERFTLNLGGAEGSFGSQAEPSLLENSNKTIRIASIICYESIFGEHLNGFINKGANVVFLLTNDGWWGGTPGYLQHLNYARLRAIETRRSIARCANTGISAIIDTRGNVVKSSEWWQRTAFSGSIGTNTQLTFYVNHGDYIGRIALFLSACIVLILMTTVIRKKP